MKPKYNVDNNSRKPLLRLIINNTKCRMITNKPQYLYLGIL